MGDMMEKKEAKKFIIDRFSKAMMRDKSGLLHTYVISVGDFHKAVEDIAFKLSYFNGELSEVEIKDKTND